MKDSNIDIVSINETKLDSSINDNEVYTSGYEIVRKDRKINGRQGSLQTNRFTTCSNKKHEKVQ
jgi:hypothetical protein